MNGANQYHKSTANTTYEEAIESQEIDQVGNNTN